MKISIKVEYTLQLLQQHKERHTKAHEEAKKGWETKMEEFSQKLSKWALAGGIDKVRPKEPQKPINYTKEYDDLIFKISHHQETLIGLEDYEFDQVVKDKFGWSRGFLASNSTYLAADSVKSYFSEDVLNEDEI